MADVENLYFRAGKRFKKMRKTMTISDLQKFIIKHFKLPNIQITESLNGIVIANLFDGIPEDVESQDHEAFDNILNLVGWVEGCVELPRNSKLTKVDGNTSDMDKLTKDDGNQNIGNKVLNQNLLCEVLKNDEVMIPDEETAQNKLKSKPNVAMHPDKLVAHQLLDEMPEPGTDLKTVEGQEELSKQDGLSFDPGGKSSADLAQNSDVNDDVDDVLTVERPMVDDVLMMDEQPAQMETIDESNVEKEVVDLVAHHVLDEMPSAESVIYDPEGEVVVRNLHPTKAVAFDDVLALIKASEMKNSLKSVDSLQFDIVVDEHDCWIPKLDYMGEFIINLGGGFIASREVGLCINASDLHDPYAGMLAFANGSHKMSFEFPASSISQDGFQISTRMAPKHGSSRDLEVHKGKGISDFNRSHVLHLALLAGIDDLHLIRCLEEELPEMRHLFRVPSFGIMTVNHSDHLALKWDRAQVHSIFQEWVVETYWFGSLTCLKIFCFDPGKEHLLVTGMTNSSRIDLLGIRLNRHGPLTLGFDQANGNPMFQKLNLVSNEVIASDSVRLLQFDESTRISHSLMCSLNAFKLLIEENNSSKIFIFDSRGEELVLDNWCAKEWVFASVENDLHGTARGMTTILGSSWYLEVHEFHLFVLNHDENVESIVTVECSYFDSQLLIFYPGITLMEEWKTERNYVDGFSSSRDLACCCLHVYHSCLSAASALDVPNIYARWVALLGLTACENGLFLVAVGIIQFNYVMSNTEGYFQAVGKHLKMQSGIEGNIHGSKLIDDDKSDNILVFIEIVKASQFDELGVSTCNVGIFELRHKSWTEVTNGDVITLFDPGGKDPKLGDFTMYLSNGSEHGQEDGKAELLEVKEDKFAVNFVVGIISTSHSKGLHVMVSDEYKVGIHTSASFPGNCASCLDVLPCNSYISYKYHGGACIRVTEHDLTFELSEKLNIDSFMNGMSSASCNLFVLAPLLVVMNPFGMGTGNFVVLVFDPGGDWSRISDIAPQSRILVILKGMEFLLVSSCPAIRLVLKTSWVYCSLILEDKDLFQRRVLLQSKIRGTILFPFNVVVSLFCWFSTSGLVTDFVKTGSLVIPLWET